MKPKSYLAFDLLFALIVIMILAASAFTSCTYQKKIIIKEPEGQGQVIVINNSDIVMILDANKTLNVSEEQKPEPAEQPAQQAQEQNQEEEPEKVSEQTTDQVPSASARASEVEFYFLLTGKSYFKATQKENQAKTYNISGQLVTINPIFIGNEEVVFKINEKLTEGLSEKEWGITPEYELMVSAIYYRP